MNGMCVEALLTLLIHIGGFDFELVDPGLGELI